MRFPALAVALAVASTARADDAAVEAALKAAAAAAAPSVVKIETSGGLEVAPATPGAAPAGPGGGPPPVRLGTGPTTGVVVGADGFVVTSSFNFARKPADVFVTVPGRPRQVARVVATDQTRMLTLLKVDATGLPVPAAVPAAEVEVGRWAVALGRALDPDPAAQPGVSVGVISAVGRIYGKMTQTDAKISPVNYGGLLVAADGRAFGVLVPASPRGETDTAGVEWYDSGIGFAVPFADVLAACERLKPGKDLQRGLLGVTPKAPDELYNKPAEVGAVGPGSAAEKAGIKAGDTITRLDGKPTPHFSAVQHALGPKYAGDAVAVTVTRGGKPVEFPAVTLTAGVTAFAAPFLGILPVRDDPGPGVEVRYVYPDSPAAAAGVQAGDRVMKFGRTDLPAEVPADAAFPAVAGRDALARQLAGLRAGTEVKLAVKRKGTNKTDTLTLKLAALPDTLPAELPTPSSARRALEKPGKKADKPNDAKPAADGPETGLVRRNNPTLGRETWLYVPENYDPNVAHGVILWLHRAGAGVKDADDLERVFGRYCVDHHFILVGPRSKNATGWVASETEEVLQEVKLALSDYTIDRARVVAHGMGNGGQMAFYLGFTARDLVRGVATTGAVLGTAPKDPVANQPLQFFVVAGEQDPAVKDIAAAVPRLTEKKYPVVYRQLKEFGKEYLLDTTLAELMAWMDSLDRL